VILALSFVAVLYLAHYEIMFKREFPAVDCDEIINTYGTTSNYKDELKF